MSAEDYGNIYDEIDLDLQEYENTLWAMTPKQLIDTITSYKDQNALNKNSDGKKKDFPIGFVADSVAKNNYSMSPKQRTALIQTYAIQTLHVYIDERDVSDKFITAIDDLSKTELTDLSR